MATLGSVSQCRTLTHLYLFKRKTEYSVLLKFYDLSQQCIAKTTLTFSQLGLSDTTAFTLSDPSRLLETIRQKN